MLGVLCYLKHEGRTLMIHRNRKHGDVHLGKWNTLGGKIESGETPEECAIREVREESGLEVKNPRLRGLITFPEFADEQDWFVFVFTCTEFSGEPLKECAEGSIHWVNDADLPSLPLWEGDHIFMKWLGSEQFWSARFEYDSRGLKNHSVVFHGKADSTPD